MDCVECSTCRLWGKLKVHGLAVAFRILFSEDVALALSRNEVVALFNSLAQCVLCMQKRKANGSCNVQVFTGD